MYQKQDTQLSDIKIRESQVHLATRMDRRDNHSRRIIEGDRAYIISMLSINGCFVCHKSMFEILEGVGGAKCTPGTALKASYGEVS